MKARSMSTIAPIPAVRSLMEKTLRYYASRGVDLRPAATVPVQEAA